MSENKQVIVTRQTQIPIPFAISAANQQKLASVELVYSMDRGENWYSYQSISPGETNFEFNAPEDAEYWFVIRAKYKTGEIKQLGATPAACAIVDTHPPQLTLEARRNDSGEVVVEWSLEDTVLKTDGYPVISLSYDSNLTWMTLAVDPKNVKREGNREKGHVTFWPLHDAVVVDIRCDSEDAAGNKEIQTTRLELKQPQNVTPLQQAANAPQDQNGSTVDFVAVGVANDVQPVPDLTVAPPRPFVAHKPPQQNGESVAETPEAVASMPSSSDNMLMDLVKNMGGSPPSAVSADVTQRYANRADGTTGNSPAMPNMLPDASPAQYVPASDSRTAASPGAGAVAAKQDTPFPGKISLISLGQFGEQQCIIVRWLPGDANFADSKVDLYRSETLHGPWRPIAFDLKNTGEYYWLVSAADKMPFYVRVDLRSKQGLFTDFTVQTITLPLSFNDSGRNDSGHKESTPDSE